MVAENLLEVAGFFTDGKAGFNDGKRKRGNNSKEKGALKVLFRLSGAPQPGLPEKPIDYFIVALINFRLFASPSRYAISHGCTGARIRSEFQL